MQLVLDTKGITLTKKRNAFYIEAGEQSRVIGPTKISSIAITANCSLSANAVKLAIKFQIPIFFFDDIGKAKGRLWSPYFESLATLRRQQTFFAMSQYATQWVIAVFGLKTKHQIENLKYLQKQEPSKKSILDANILKMQVLQKKMDAFKKEKIKDCNGSLMGIEGNIAKIYWQSISICMPKDFQFEKRSRRPAEDIYNAATNYLYGMTYTIVEAGVFAAGLDPQLGILHADDYHKPTLAFDMIEPFRGWIDRLLIEQCLQGKVEKRFFTSNKHGVFLNKHGKAYIIPLFNKFMRQEKEFQNMKVSHKNQIYHFAGKLATRIRRVKLPK